MDEPHRLGVVHWPAVGYWLARHWIGVLACRLRGHPERAWTYELVNGTDVPVYCLRCQNEIATQAK